jgi:hypothetical protein
MMRHGFFHLGPAIALCLLPTLAYAQTGTGSIAGTVRDTTGAILPGVTVEVSSPALIEKVRVGDTDASGQYKIIELPPGVYTVLFTLSGFSGVKREGIELSTGFTATINADMPVGNIAETITVSGQSPLVDTQNVRQQAVMTRDVIDAIPTGKTYGNLGALIPGVTLASAGGQQTQDVGGATGVSFTQLAIHGGRRFDQTLQINGMSITNLDNESITTINFTDGNIQEMVMDVAAQSAESELGGVRVNIIPKDGGNSYRGSLAANFSNDALQADNYSTELQARGLRAPNSVKRLWNVAPGFGGPVVRDKLWFFGAYGTIGTENYVADMFVNRTPAAWRPTLDRAEQAVDDQTTHDANVRLTWQASQKNKLSFYYDYNRGCQCHFLVAATRTPEASSNEIRPNHLFQATWTLPVTNRLLLEAGGSFSSQILDRQPQADSTQPTIVEQQNGLGYRAISWAAIESLVYLHQDVRNYNVRGSASYVTGSHAVKVGMTYIYASETMDGKHNHGNVSYTVLNGTPTRVTYWNLPYSNTFRLNPKLAVFAQDQWTVNRLTVNAGLRYDYLASDYPDLEQPPGMFFPTARTFPGQTVVRWHDVSPRLGASYDLFGNGRTALKTSLSRYVQQQASAPARPVTPVTANLTNGRIWTDNGDLIVQGDPLNHAQNGELGPSANVNFGQPATTSRYDPDFAFGWGVRPANWEVSAGVQHELMPRLSVGAAYFRRSYVNIEVTDNLAVASSDYDTYCVTAPLDSRLPNGGGQRICDLYDLRRERVGFQDSVRTFSSPYGDQIERWNGVDLTVNARLQNNLLLQGGVSTGKTLTDNCDVVGKIDNPSTLYCRVETPFLTQVKLLGSYTLPWDIQVAGTLQAIPGPQITATAVFTNAQIQPSLGRALGGATTANVNVVAPGTMYGDRLYQLDLRLGKMFTVGRTRLHGLVDFYNALNADTVLTLNNTWGTNGASWQVPTFIVQARVVKFGIQMTF